MTQSNHTKTCCTCNQTLTMEFFSKMPLRKDGTSNGWRRACDKCRSKELEKESRGFDRQCSVCGTWFRTHPSANQKTCGLKCRAISITIKSVLDGRIRWTKDKITGCWNWNGAPTEYGYGEFKLNGKKIAAHRAVYEAIVGPIPTGLILHHKCKNKICVNPEHLQPLTNAQHMACHATIPDEVIRSIRAIGRSKVHKEIAEMFGIDSSTVCDILNFRTRINVT